MASNTVTLTSALPQKQHAPSQEKTKQHTKGTSPSGKKENRNAKRKRWAKKNRPAPKSITPRGPSKEYISACCSLPARKPAAGMKSMGKDPETGKMKETRKGLGHWRCSGCSKPTKVTPRKPEPKTEVPIESQPQVGS
jgi:hypothetical protein